MRLPIPFFIDNQLISYLLGFHRRSSHLYFDGYGFVLKGRVNDIGYQGFSLLTANQPVLNNPEIARIAKKYAKTPSQVVFRFAIDVGMTPGGEPPSELAEARRRLAELEAAETERARAEKVQAALYRIAPEP